MSNRAPIGSNINSHAKVRSTQERFELSGHAHSALDSGESRSSQKSLYEGSYYAAMSAVLCLSLSCLASAGTTNHWYAALWYQIYMMLGKPCCCSVYC